MLSDNLLRISKKIQHPAALYIYMFTYTYMCTHKCTRMISQPKDRIRCISESHHTPKRWTSQNGFPPRKDLQDAKSKELIAELKPQIVEQVKVWAVWAAGAGCCSV